MSDLDWSKLLESQAQHCKNEQILQQHRKQHLKNLYKNELQKMIEYHRTHAHDQRDQDRRLIRQAEEKEKRKILQDRELEERKLRVKGMIAEDNLRTVEQRRDRAWGQLEMERKFYADRFQKVKTQAQHQSQSRVRQRQQEKQQLAKAYEAQIRNEQTRKKLQKLQDEKFSQLQQQLQRKKQQNRRYYLNKIRNGYKQNPEVYQHSAHLLLQHQQQKSSFLTKFSTESTLSQQSQKQQKQKQLQNQTKQTSKFNKNNFQAKVLRDRYQSLKEISDFGMRNRTIQEEAMWEREREVREMERKRRMLRVDLERQIQEARFKEMRKNQMSQKEYRLNKGTQVPALPGLSRDFNSQKQYKILQSFLKAESSKKLDHQP